MGNPAARYSISLLAASDVHVVDVSRLIQRMPHVGFNGEASNLIIGTGGRTHKRPVAQFSLLDNL